jgi:steroid 5-alpha reductase family enzyme
MRRHYGARFWAISLGTVFLLQAGLMWIVSLPLQWAVLSTRPPQLNWLDVAATALCLVGLFFEATGDYQLARFRAEAGNADAVMDRGLWRYTRHPNYFGDCVFWWGLFLFALNTPGGYVTLIGPVIMTALLLRVSGVALLERSIGRRRPAYAAYVRRTSAFVPWPPRSAGDAESR